MGATPAEYGFVFGIANLSLFIFSPIFGRFGPKIGTKTCFNLGAVLQGVSGFLFAFLPYLKTTGSFIGLAYLLRFLEGLGNEQLVQGDQKWPFYSVYWHFWKLFGHFSLIPSG